MNIFGFPLIKNDFSFRCFPDHCKPYKEFEQRACGCFDSNINCEEMRNLPIQPLEMESTCCQDLNCSRFQQCIHKHHGENLEFEPRKKAENLLQIKKLLLKN